MKLISFLLRSAPGVVVLAVTAGLVAGISNTALLVIINQSLAGASGWLLAGSFAGVCLLMLVSRATSSVLLIRLSRGSIFKLRLKLCRQILAAPLRHL
jgi:putative pyoverdin transport system ATP-binding/permease protein